MYAIVNDILRCGRSEGCGEESDDDGDDMPCVHCRSLIRGLMWPQRLESNKRRTSTGLLYALSVEHAVVDRELAANESVDDEGHDGERRR